MDDGLFELIVIKNLVSFGKIVTGNMLANTEDIIIISTNKATIQTDIPIYFKIDGTGRETNLDIMFHQKKLR
jgi:diacylglycerol kinase family enzyme